MQQEKKIFEIRLKVHNIFAIKSAVGLNSLKYFLPFSPYAKKKSKIIYFISSFKNIFD